MIYLFTICLSSYVILLISGNEFRSFNGLAVNIKLERNDTIILYYNLTTNYSYYLTFRIFEHEQIKFGQFLPNDQFEQRSIQISNQYNIATESFYLFIICFYIILSLNDIDIECKDIRLLKDDEIEYNHKHHASYKPSFVLLMYALSILMLLPVIAQHRHRRNVLVAKRKKELKRYSLSLTQNNSTILSPMTDNGTTNLRKIPIEIEPTSLSTIQIGIDDMDDNDRLTFTIPKSETYTTITTVDDNNDDDITADDCIAHLLNNTPWNSSLTQKSSKINPRRRNSPKIDEEQHVLMLTIPGNIEYQQSNLNLNVHHAKKSFDVNPTFTESGV